MMKKFTGILVSSLFVISAAWAAGGSPTVSSDIEKLGMRLYNDKNMSFNGTQSCRNCHHPFSGFADITNHLDPYTNFVSTGADGVSKGGRNAPSSAYAGFSPILALDEASSEWVGGMFWDGRATGWDLGDPLAEQAQGPPLNPVEMTMPSKDAVIQIIKDSDYVNLWNSVFGTGSLEDVAAAYDNFGIAIAAYERSTDVTKFTSKFDTAVLSDKEKAGRDLFQTNCASCHSITKAFGAPAALFTNYKYANIGVPANDGIPSEGADLGLGPIVGDAAQDGKFKIPTLRNIALTAPYSHNGVFPTLMEMLEFLNDRSVFTPEVEENLSTKVGNLGLTPNQLKEIEAFLMTLTDDY
ncbi:MAG TPA: cytochrome-c peroxidase [Desulfobacter sp.]|uniref:cytochrome-c peroxidase n=1 Tax=Desulfobacter sp. UBA2225 TaxID=1961413 RepID=UPI000E841644|nr:cytochrome c peroxidase [Desulfobacter sp. UBA2225]HAR33431.1 cytochrome-c peroxidase [Desulfobacter sp.]